MKNVFLINTSLKNDKIKERIEKAIDDGIAIDTSSISDFTTKAQYYSTLEKCETIYAVGGDGTVNLLATILVNTSKKLGIIPIGKNNKIYHSLSGLSTIDVGYINEHLFLNHAIIDKTVIDIENIDKYNYQTFCNFEFATNVRGKYEILSTDIFAIINTKNGNEQLLNDGKMEVSWLESKRNIFNRLRKEKFKHLISTNQFDVDCLGTLPIIIDGDIYSVDKFHFKVASNKLFISNDEVVKKLGLFKIR